MRVTNSMLFRLTLRDLGNIASENARLLEAAGTGLRISKPSDDPVGTVRQLRLRDEIAYQMSKESTTAAGLDEALTTELALDDTISIFQRAKEIAIQGASGARTDADFKAIESEASQLLHDLLGLSNRRVNERFIFAGTMTTVEPFEFVGSPPTGVQYNGNTGGRYVTPSPGVNITVNLSGNNAFIGAVNVFDAIIQLRDAAIAQDVDALAGDVSEVLDDAMNKMVDLRTQFGSITGSLQRTAGNLSKQTLQTEELLSKVQDVDMVETLVGLQTIENRRTAALQAASRVIQHSLLDFMA